MEANEQLAVPPEGGIVRSPQDKAHGLVVAAHERGVLLAGLDGPVSGEDAVDFFEGDRHSFHRSGSGLSN